MLLIRTLTHEKPTGCLILISYVIMPIFHFQCMGYQNVSLLMSGFFIQYHTYETYRHNSYFHYCILCIIHMLTQFIIFIIAHMPLYEYNIALFMKFYFDGHLSSFQCFDFIMTSMTSWTYVLMNINMNICWECSQDYLAYDVHMFSFKILQNDGFTNLHFQQY